MSVISFNTIHLEQNMGHGKDVDIPFFSVAMCVYGKDNPDWFDKALCSVIDQTVQPDEIVLVVDGPIPDSIQNVIDNQRNCNFCETFPEKTADRFIFYREQ